MGRDLLTWIRSHELNAMIESFSGRKVRLGLAHLRRAHGCDPTPHFVRMFLRSYARWSLKVLLQGPGPAGRIGGKLRDQAIVGEAPATP